MTREECKTKIDEMVKENHRMVTMLCDQNDRLMKLKMSDYMSVDVDEAYQRGLNDAWECARRVVLNAGEGGIDAEELYDMFPCGCYNIFNGYSVQEVMKRIEDQKDVIKIGDEVKFNHDDIKATVMDKSDKEDMWWLYTENGCIEEWQDAYFRKTGRTFPQIAEMLKAMQEGADE